MLKSFLYSIPFIFILTIAGAQDTMVVQTFTWDSIGRSGTFNFPEGDDSYEKILMIYNMRCFDAAVGNGNVGCKEWDYSCNTFVHTPEKVDSSLKFSYDYQVSQNSEDYFAYTHEPHYTYYASDAISTDYKKTYSEITGEIAPETGLDLLLNSSSRGRNLYLYTTEELSHSGFGAGEINGLGLYIRSENASFQSLKIRVKEVDEMDLQKGFNDFETFQTVFFQDMQFSEAGWHRFNFHEPFIWDGQSSLIVDLSYDDHTQGMMLSGHEISNKALVASNNEQEHALEFGGSWGVELEESTFQSISNEVTLAFWVFGRPQDLPKKTTILEALDANNNRTINVHLPWSDSNIYWDCGNSGSSYDRINKIADSEAIKGQWNHWAFTKNSETGIMNIYLNGILWHTGENKTKLINIHKIRLGSSVSHNLGYFGMIDEFSIWDRELTLESIQEIMLNSIDSQHPFYNHLLSYYNFEEGEGGIIRDASSNESSATFEGGPMWRKNKGANLHLNFESKNERPTIRFYRGSYDIENTIVQKIDTVLTPQHSIVHFGVEDNTLVALDTFFNWEASDSKIYNEKGEELESIFVEAEDFLLFEELAYYTFSTSKLELLSLVTPYGNGLDLGPYGKTFSFDISDFAPVLKGSRKISVEFGSTQEELDIKFLFIKGIPSREVLDIMNIWPFARGYYKNIQDDKIFEPRNFRIPPSAKMAKIRSSITGHGQNGEFQSRKHRIRVNNQQDFDFTVWKECALNPIFPQGGTWIYDRAGWCPGMATDLHEFDLTSIIDPGDEIELEYAVLGLYMDQANYLVSNQLVLYDNPNFTLDAAVERIIRPNQNAVEFERFNPLCSDPGIIIKNNGTEILQSLSIYYGIEGLTEKRFDWSGSLDFLEMEEVHLPVDDLGFWGTEEYGEFYVRIENPNGLNDPYSNNNSARSLYQKTDVYEGYERWLLRVRTNSRAAENEYSLYNQDGNVLLSRKNLKNNTTYDDELMLPPGCYSFEITDSGNDGLSFWNNPAAGSGWVSIRRMENETISFERIKFESDFGAKFQYDFIIDESTDVDTHVYVERMSLFPNPASNHLYIEAEGLSDSELRVDVFSIDGKKIFEDVFYLKKGVLNERIETDTWKEGHYVLRFQNDTSVWAKSFIKIN